MTLTPGIEQLEADVTVIQAGPGDITVGDGTFLFNAEFTRSGGDLTISGADGAEVVVTGYFEAASPANLLSDGGAMLSGELVDILAGPLAPGQYAQATGAQNGPTPIGTVVSATGNVAATRADGSSVTLAEGAPVFAGDVILTATGATVNLVFLDGTVFNMAESARMVLNSLVYEEGGSNNSMLFSILQGGFSFFAGQIAPTGDMQVTTPVATLGIRGTSPWVFSFDGITFEYSVMPDPISEIIGSYTLFSLINGQLIATVSQTSTKFVLNSPSAIPQEVTKTPDELAADVLRQRELTDSFSTAQPFLQQLQGPGGGQQRGDIDDGTQQDTSAPVPAAGPEFSQIQSSGINAENIAESQAEDIGQTETTAQNSFALDPFGTSSGSSGSGGGGITGNELLSETSDEPPPSEPVVESGGTTPPPEETSSAPIIILPDAPTITEDTSIVLNGFSIQDSSGSILTVEITAQSTVTLASVAGLTFLVGDGVNDEFLIFEGSAEDINNALNGMTYIPTADNDVVGGIDITVSNGNAEATSSLTVVIDGENDAPVAVDDTDTVVEGNSLGNIAVLDNDFDVDGDDLTVIGATAAHGTVTVNSNNTLRYTPDEGFTGTDTIIYTVSDGADPEPLTDTASVVIKVTPDTSNDDPVAGDDAARTDEDTTLQGIVVLSNDTDANEDPLTVTGATALNGTVVVNSDGTIDYTPNANFYGTDTIIYDISDGNGGTDAGAVVVTVDPVNDRPVANNDAVSTDEDTPLTINVLANDIDVDGDPLTVTDAFLGDGTFITSDELVFTDQVVFVSNAIAVAGSVTINDDGTLNYTPPSDFSGTDTITYTINDGNGGTDTGEVTVTVAPVDDIADDSASTTQDTSVTIDVLTNDTFEDEGAFVSDFTQGGNGSVVIGTGDSLTYTPDEGFTGTDSFEYTVTSGGATETATVTVTVDSNNAPPVAQPDSASTDEDVALTDINVLGNDFDPDEDPLAVIRASALNGEVTINSDGTLNYTPFADFSGPDTITYTIDDSNGGTAESSVSVAVNPVNDAPVVNLGIADQTTQANSLISFSIPADAFVDIEDTATALTYTAQLTGGDALPDWLTFDGTTFSGTPAAVDGGVYAIEVVATDTGGLTVTTSFDLAVTQTQLGTINDDPELIGTAGDDFIDGLAGNDTIDGLGGNDQLLGGDGNDTIRSGGATLDWIGWEKLDGGSGNDTLIAEGGGALLTGGQGNDSLSTTTTFSGDGWWDWAQANYTTSPGGIFANLTGEDVIETVSGTSQLLTAGQVWDGFGTIDQIGTFDGFNIVDGVQVIRDSTFDDVILVDGSYQNSYGNWIEVRLSSGDDLVDFTGMYGTARISWQNAGGGVNASLLTGTATDVNSSDNFIGNDTFIGANYLRGSRYDDILSGDGMDNIFRGSKGNDIIDGGIGIDRIDHSDSGSGIIVDLSLSSGQVVDDGHGTTDDLNSIENVNGSYYDDQITGDASANYLRGYFGNDTILGGAGNDVLQGDFGNRDGLLGGDDHLDGGAGDDRLYGGVGNDTLLSGGAILNWFSWDFLDGGEGDDTLIAQGGGTGILGGQGNDTISSSTTFSGDGWWDWVNILYYDSPSAIYANLTGVDRTDIIDGVSRTLSPGQIWDGHGTIDTIGNFDGTDINDAAHVIRDSSYDDRIYVNGSYQNSFGNWIEVRLSYGDDIVEFTGITGTARISWQSAGGGVNASLATGTAADVFEGDNYIGNDTFSGATFLRGSNYDDILTGDAGNNTFRGSGGNDLIDGGDGSDWINHTSPSNGIVVDLSLETGQVIEDGYDGTDTLISIENVRGTDYDDDITGDSGANILKGSFGNDVLEGKAGNDTLQGDAGNNGGLLGGDDILDGGTGNDSLEGGVGADLYIFRPRDGDDEILGFNIAQGDLIDVSAYGLTSADDFDSIFFDGTDTIIDPGGVGTIVVRDVDLETVLNRDSLFVFAAGTLLIVQAQPGDFNDIFDNAFYETDVNEGNLNFTATTTGPTSPETFTVVNTFDSNRITTFTGSGLTFDGQGNPTGGTINSITFSLNMVTLATITGLSELAVELFAALASEPTDDGAALDAILVAYDFEYIGTAGDDAAELDGVNDDFLFGGSGNDFLTGGDGNDTLLSGGAQLNFNGLDILDGGSGDDTLISQGGHSYLIGGAGNDTIETATEFAGDQFWDWAKAVYQTSPTGIYANLTNSNMAPVIDGEVRILGPGQVWDGFGTTDTIGVASGGRIIDGVPVIVDSPFDDHIFVDGSYQINDTYWGNWIEVRLSEGDDFINMTGMTGIGRVSWQEAGGGVNASLLTGTATDINPGDNFIGNDTFIGANALRGSSFDDMLAGNNETNYFRGSAGNDSIDGGGGTDWISHSDSPAGIIVDLSLASGQVIDDGFGSSDDLTGIENVRGSYQDDHITGDAGDNNLRGSLGNDTLIGGGGNDTLRGDFGDFGGLLGGDDVLVGGDGNDTLDGGFGNDQLSGGDGNDTLYGGIGDDQLSGGDGFDTLVGFAGADIFIIDPLDIGIGDFIDDYNIEEGDVVDLTELFEVLSSNDDLLSDFVRVNPDDTSQLQVDTDGIGTSQTWENVATLDTINGVNILYDLDGTDTSGTIT